ncbi:MAG: 30S ribosomal protein S12 methylthiotransferase RimO [Eggerthellaceae bacterium]|nr:30S ribosomal protein S12 methylthiotransferase RimO [Eggerthellaceae bacterium]
MEYSTAEELASVAFITMGCAKNEVDSEHMARRLVQSGYALSDDPEAADIVIVNTCSFIQAATEESIEAILQVADFDSVANGESKLVVAGCMPARYGAELEGEIPEASGFVACDRESDIVSVLDDLLGIERLSGDGLVIPIADLKDNCVSAYVKISDGCDRFCAYCTIPYIRGRYHSFSQHEIFDEVNHAVGRGAREIVLIAQDTGRWGSDLSPRSSLAQLMSDLADEWPDVWFRVMYIQPEGITDELISAVKEHDNICSYFDIPFQHANERILKSMNRKGSGTQFLDLLARIRKQIPSATLRTTLIAGYPGETEEDFDELCAFVEDAGFDYVGVFAYSQEDGTKASLLDCQIDEEEKAYRAQNLRDLADSLSSVRVADRVGSTIPVLVCGFEEDGQLYGRAQCQAPDVDGVTYLDGGNPGDIVTATIDDTLLYEMEGTMS